MPARFPTLSSHPLPGNAREMLSALKESLDKGTLSDGYLRAETPAGEWFLFFHQGKAHSAGSLEEDRFAARAFGEFFGALAGATHVRFCATDPALLLCTAVLFRKAPSAQIPARLLNSEELLYAIRETGKDAVLVVRSGDAHSLAFIKSGEPAALFVADGEPFPQGSAVADRIVAYVKEKPSSHLDLYDEIQLKPSTGSGQPLESYLGAVPRGAAAKDAPPPSLIVRLGERVAFRFPVTEDEALIGRGEAADLPLDNVSVSRRHAKLRRQGASLVIEDLGSDNGVVFKGEKVKRATLAPGDEVTIGKYTLIYPRYASQDDGIAVGAPRASRAMEVEQTLMISDSKTPPAVFEHRGQKVKMGGLVFTIGKSSEAHLRIGGFLVAGIHARVMRDPTGAHILQRVGGWRSVTVNGRAVKTATLKDGDVIGIAGAQMKFSISAAPASGSQSASRLGPPGARSAS